MGTDISLYAEVKREGVWHFAGAMEENPEYYPQENPKAQRVKPVEIYRTRNYNLFAILADVRNPNGRTLNGEKFEVIASPRGWPEDLSPELRNWFSSWEDDYLISPGWLLLSEILRFDWQRRRMRFEAMVDARVAPLFQEDKPFPHQKWPREIPTGFGGYLRAGVTVRWTATYADSVGPDALQLFEQLKKLGTPSRVRLVFCFD